MIHYFRESTTRGKSSFVTSLGTHLSLVISSISWRQPRQEADYHRPARSKTNKPPIQMVKSTYRTAFRSLNSQRRLTRTTNGTVTSARSLCKRPRHWSCTACPKSSSSVSNASRHPRAVMASAGRKLTLMSNSRSKASTCGPSSSCPSKETHLIWSTIASGSRITSEVWVAATTPPTLRTRSVASGTTSMTARWGRSARAAATTIWLAHLLTIYSTDWDLMRRWNHVT